MKRLADLGRSSIKSSLGFITGSDKVPGSPGNEEKEGKWSHQGQEVVKGKRRLPWEPRTEAEVPYERELRSKILRLSLDTSVWLEGYRESERVGVEEVMDQAGDMLQVDENLRNVRFSLVPKVLTEEEFWERYFAAIARVRVRVLEASSSKAELAVEEQEEEAVEKACLALKNMSAGGTSVGSSKLGRRLDVRAKQLRHMARALETAKGYRKMEDLADAGKPSTSASRSTGWKGVLASKVEAGRNMLAKKMSGGGRQEKVLWDLFDPEDAKEADWDVVKAFFPSTMKMTAQIAAAGPCSFLGHLANEMGKMTTMAQMSLFWVQVVEEIRWHFRNLKTIPRVPPGAPDLQSCPLNQKLMLLNACIGRKARFAAQLAKKDEDPVLEVKLADGTLVRRRGHKSPIEGMKMISTGEDVFVPHTQEEGSVLTEELMREQEDLISKTGTIGPGLQQLLSDMEAFKAANPGSILADFVRWYSPADWEKREGEEPCLSSRMREPGNMWTEMFKKARPVPSSEQNPLFDFDYHGEMTIESLVEIAPSDLFEQLFIVSICIRHALLEEESINLKETEPNSKVMAAVAESEEFSVTTISRGMSSSKVEKICNAYETVEDFIFNCMPEEHLDEELYESDYHETPWGIL
ncbi:catalytic subunit of Rab3 GTPase-activating protein [Chloropicon primus]|uniref:Catalytic subunit of Rab3 GTPase-activating protein n=1 Tax=Chloropicon primus TaxID=1764295 RepID=A0A5B8MH94_9CHLO|nr:catalytic subunit of Rab3 GTPase-activating protein [Chloropicon primus]UPQ98863.1 catalytic subunit of Rab3 GTPase-activating protein [Chloropicon primus]|mmetsp:Transcript_1312/g.3792  ORF Transcript_1312/g.3792 Transcript_1312/m.3792 type:complete len:636 (+) Transcript_1312:100-2007(+)|eukprot:QDZ19651.1 catalytic subunit of Rab3 GTPase-activating protein [Chloropicon primus]